MGNKRAWSGRLAESNRDPDWVHLTHLKETGEENDKNDQTMNCRGKERERAGQARRGGRRWD